MTHRKVWPGEGPVMVSLTPWSSGECFQRSTEDLASIKIDQSAIRIHLPSINSHHNGPQPWVLLLFNFSHPEPITELSMDWLIKVSLMNVFPYLAPAFGKIAASKEYSVTQSYVGEALKKGKRFLLM